MSAATACDCLTGHVWGDAALAHWESCARRDDATVGDLDGTPERALAELASFRDIDVAMSCMRQLRRR
jgi:hypothetical protein